MVPVNGYEWVCKECGHRSDDGYGVLDHREATEHVGATVRFDGSRRLPRNGHVPGGFADPARQP